MLACFMLVSAGVSFYYGTGGSLTPLLYSAFITAIVGVFPIIFVKPVDQINNREGYFIVAGAWLFASLFGMLPYILWGGEFIVVNAFFESVSGFTTTGASILNDVESLPRGLLFWRMCTAWIGGVGVVMFAILVLPSMKGIQSTLSNVELSSIAKEQFHTTTQAIIKVLIVTYVILTFATAIALRIAGMCWFDALTHAMSACSTCGFGTRNASIAAFNSPAIEIILIISMTLAGMNFGVLSSAILVRKKSLFKYEVVRTYLAMIGIATLLVTVDLFANRCYPTLGEDLRRSLFHVVSLTSTTGFAVTDTNLWPAFSVCILIFCSIVCACSGSTSGGLKTDRMVIAAKVFSRRIKQQRSPNGVFRIAVDGKTQSDESVDNVMLFIVVYLCLIGVGTFLYTLFGTDLMTGFSASVACLGNVGPGFGDIGSICNYASIPSALKIVSVILMLLGRLEVFGVFQILFLRNR